MSSNNKTTITDVDALEVLDIDRIEFPDGVRLATDTKANLLAAAPSGAGLMRVASDTGELMVSDSDNKYHSTRARGYAYKYLLTFNNATFEDGVADITAPTGATGNRLSFLSTDGIKLPPGFGQVLGILNWTSTATEGFSIELGETGGRRAKAYVDGTKGNGTILFDLSGGFSSGVGAVANTAAGHIRFHYSGPDNQPTTAVLDIISTGQEIFYQLS